ncbi:hypothetical protein HF086_008227 [Spodoptera exigua]|uniref:Uncharacterized protein n=1 Tax=Spodoptera exigua TaxID=7107 RepID=A0A922MI93_SPOEX|nr:hypothetical protein HF086_008227 [Spodoptera exigua]
MRLLSGTRYNTCSNIMQVQIQRHTRPVSYAGDAECRGAREARHPPQCYVNRVPDTREQCMQYASSSMLDEIDSAANIDALKTRSLPAFLRPKPRPLSTEDDLQQLYAKVSLSDDIGETAEVIMGNEIRKILRIYEAKTQNEHPSKAQTDIKKYKDPDLDWISVKLSAVILMANSVPNKYRHVIFNLDMTNTLLHSFTKSYD